MGMPSGPELFIILGIVVLLFGGKKIPELMRGVGSGIKNFKNAVKDDDTTVAKEADDIKKVETAEIKKETKAEETVKQA